MAALGQNFRALFGQARFPRMNQLTIHQTTVTLEDGSRHAALELLIDGESLIEAVRRYERPMAEAEGHPDLAAAYAWPAPSAQRQDLLLQGSGAEDKVALLECACGQPGCWPLLATVTVGSAQVIWSGFEQPHRRADSAGGHWDYGGFGPFVFERAVYDAALQAAARA